MAQISVVVHGKSYAISCDDGQEQHVLRLTADIDRRVAQLVAANGQVGQERLLLLVSLLLADELADRARERGGDAAGATAAAVDDTLGDELHTLARRIETMADRLRPTVPQVEAGTPPD